MIESLQDWTTSLPPAIQWLAVMAIAAIPFVESYFGSAIGVIAGIHPVVAVVAAIIGNTVSMLAFVLSAHGIRGKVTKDQELSPKRQKLKRMFDRFGVPGMSLLGQLVLPSQITSAAMVSFGASKNAVIAWQIVSIILWGVLFGVLASLGIQLAR